MRTPFLKLSCIVLFLSLAGCASVYDYYSRAKTLDTVPAYQEFLKKYPRSSYSAVAKERISALIEGPAFEEAEQENTIVAYKEFVEKFPDGAHADEARKRVGESDEDAFIRTVGIGSKLAFEGFIQSYPDSKHILDINDYLQWLGKTRIGLVLDCPDKDKHLQFKDAIEKVEPRILLLSNSSDTRGNDLSALVSVKYCQKETNPERTGKAVDAFVDGIPRLIMGGMIIGGLMVLADMDLGAPNVIYDIWTMSVKGGDALKGVVYENSKADIKDIYHAETITWLTKKEKVPVEFLNAGLHSRDSCFKLSVITLLDNFETQQSNILLVAAVKDEDPAIGIKAFEILRKRGDCYAYDLLAASMKDGLYEVRSQKFDEAKRRKIAFECGAKDDPRTFEMLILALKDKDKIIRSNAALSLGELGDGRAVESLLSALKDMSYEVYVRESVKSALKSIGSGCVEWLVAALNDEDIAFREAIIGVLGEIKDHRAVEPLIAKLNDDVVKLAAVNALGRIGDYRAVEPLLAMLMREKDNNKKDIALALKNITGQDLGDSPRKWQKWWDKNKSKYEAEIVNAATLFPLPPPASSTPSTPTAPSALPTAPIASTEPASDESEPAQTASQAPGN